MGGEGGGRGVKWRESVYDCYFMCDRVYVREIVKATDSVC